ncbi:MAG: DUF1156 domain-containing protein [Oscillospiraceae bacterium]|nr:DUF1156 domain-containing protein [Oscillospiraceae bacterium]
MGKLIETTLPLRAIQSADVGDWAGLGGHPANMHTWWGRTPISSTAEILKAAILDDDPSSENSVQERLRADLPDRSVTVFDPFAGFGGIPLAAQRLGLKSISGDLNPVAVMLNKAATEIPMQFAGAGPVHAPLTNAAPTVGAEGLASDVAYYGEWMLRKAKERLTSLYPQHDGQDVQAWLWTRTVKCPNPACGCDVPLANSYEISSKVGRAAWVEPKIQDGKLTFTLHQGPCPGDKSSNKFGNKGMRFRCLSCGEITSDAYVKRMGMQHQIGNHLMAVMTDADGEKRFYPPNEEDFRAAEVPAPDAVPPGAIPENAHCFRPPSFGYTEYADLFTPRQMTMLLTFSDLLRDVQDKVASDAFAAGMSPTGGTLGKGGTGALAYGEAISVYLALLVDMLAEHNAFTCSWDNRGCAPRSTFRMQTIPMQFSFGEGNPLTDISGGFVRLLKKTVQTIAKLPCGAGSRVVYGNAITAEFPKDVLVCTEFPTVKEIGLAPLSDFFYIWLRRSLQHIFPDLFNQTVIPKEELSPSSAHYGDDPGTRQAHYRQDLYTVCKKLYDCATPDYPALVIAEYRRDDALPRDGAASAWTCLISGLLSAGFSIMNTLPLRDKRTMGSEVSTRVLIVCRKGLEKRSGTTRRGLVSSLKREFPSQLKQMLRCVAPADSGIVAMGCGLRIFSSYQGVLNADGSKMTAQDALHIILQETEEYLMRVSTEENSQNGTGED